MVDREVDRAIEIGRRNKEFIELLVRHCTHARVEIFGGVGLVEEMTGLPIGHRTIRCEFAEFGTFAGMDLGAVGADFFEKNCHGCEHRNPIGIPNLATHLAEEERARDLQNQARGREEGERISVRERELEVRHQRRAALATGLSYASGRIVDLIQRLDTDGGDPAAEAELTSLARAAPELFPPEVARELLNLVVMRGSDGSLACLRFLARRRVVDPSDAVSAALGVLTGAPSRPAGDILVEFGSDVGSEAIRSVLPSLMVLAADQDYPFGSSPHPAPLLWALGRDPHGVLIAISDGLSSESTWQRGYAADAGRRTVLVESGAATALATQLLEAIDSDEVDRLYDPESVNRRIAKALGGCLEAQPAAIGEVLDAAGQAGNLAARIVIAEAYDSAVRRTDPSGVPEAVGAEVGRFLAARLLAPWGRECEQRIGSTIEFTGSYHPEILVPHLGGLLGWLIAEAGREPPQFNVLLDPEPGVIRALEAESDALAHRTAVRTVREAIGSIARHAPEAVLEKVLSLLSSEAQSGEPDRLKGELVSLLGPLGAHQEQRSSVLPRLTDALLGSDQLVRARAIESWGVIDRATGGQLSVAYSDLILTMLGDPYVVVHTGMLEGIHRGGVRVPVGMEMEVVQAVLQMAVYYQADPDLLDRCLSVCLRFVDSLDPAMRSAVVSVVLRLGAQLRSYDKRWLIRSLEGRVEPSQLEAFGDLLLGYLEDPTHLDRFNARRPEDEFEEELARLPERLITENLERIKRLAKSGLPEYPFDGLAYIQVLQRGGEWGPAADLAHELHQGIPGTIERRLVKSNFRFIAAAATVERSLGEGGAVSQAQVEGLSSDLAEYREDRRRVDEKDPWRWLKTDS